MDNHCSTTKKDVADQTVIMVVDDNPDSLKLLSDILSVQGFQVRQALNGRLALAAVKQQPPDLFILDIRMPEMDGFELCRQLKNDSATCSVPVIFISGLNDSADKVKAFDIGGQDYITKPFEHIEVLARVKLHLEVSSMRKNLEKIVLQRTINLEESNTALKVLLEHRSSEREKFEENALSHIRSLVSPYLERLKNTDLDSQQSSLLDIVEANLLEITSQFSGTLYSSSLGLTRREMEVAALIKTGKTNAEIAVLINISDHSVSFHRQNLRKKLGLLGRKVNLVAYLNEISLR
ncbi:MAG: response regulator transcription factor [Thermodesulfobacteriota bacterium]|nr:response regulator transcription factor [Thermodesulfobacteriota bacterium]